MRLLSAAFDIVLLPFDVLKDVADASICIDKSKSDTRRRLERIEDELAGRR